MHRKTQLCYKNANEILVAVCETVRNFLNLILVNKRTVSNEVLLKACTMFSIQNGNADFKMLANSQSKQLTVVNE